MALVKVTRQITDENNNLSWGTVEVDETELEPWETPLTEAELEEVPTVYAEETFYPDPFANLLPENSPAESSE